MGMTSFVEFFGLRLLLGHPRFHTQLPLADCQSAADGRLQLNGKAFDGQSRVSGEFLGCSLAQSVLPTALGKRAASGAPFATMRAHDWRYRKVGASVVARSVARLGDRGMALADESQWSVPLPP